jgi:acyl-CoA thioesterase II
LLNPDPLRHGWLYGGDLASQALFCAQQTVENHLRLSSFHSYYCSPGLGKPMEFQVKRLRDGRHNSYRRVEVLQDKRMVYHAEFMFKARVLGYAYIFMLFRGTMLLFDTI